MKKLSDERDKFLVAERKKIAAEKGETLDEAIIDAARHRANAQKLFAN